MVVVVVGLLLDVSVALRGIHVHTAGQGQNRTIGGIRAASQVHCGRQTRISSHDVPDGFELVDVETVWASTIFGAVAGAQHVATAGGGHSTVGDGVAAN